MRSKNDIYVEREELHGSIHDDCVLAASEVSGPAAQNAHLTLAHNVGLSTSPFSYNICMR